MQYGKFISQVTEYDCVPTSFINALSVLFKRKDIPPFVVQRVYLYCLDGFQVRGKGNVQGRGTTYEAQKLLGDWINDYKEGSFSVKVETYRNKKVHLGRNNPISTCLKENRAGSDPTGATVMSVTYGGDFHAVLGLWIDSNAIYCYCPYRTVRPNKQAYGWSFVEPGDSVMGENIKIEREYFNRIPRGKSYYKLGKFADRYVTTFCK